MRLAVCSRDPRCDWSSRWALINRDSYRVIRGFPSGADAYKSKVLLERVAAFAYGRSAEEVYEVALSVCEENFATRDIAGLEIGDYNRLIQATRMALQHR